MLFIYVMQGLIHAVFDTRKGNFNLFLNTVALIGSIVLTILNDGWKMVWLPLVVLFIAALVSGVTIGLIQRSRRND